MKRLINNFAITLPVIYFVFFLLTLGFPEENVVTAGIFRYQYAMTMLTIIMVPLLLWFVREERFASHYDIARYLRLIFLFCLVIADLTSFFLIPNISFFYLGAITYLSMFFALK